MNKRTFDDFDEFSNKYRDIHTANVKLTGADSFYFAEHKVLILKAQEPGKDLHVLDMGCGDGATESFFQRHLPGWRIEGIDVSQKSISEATGKNIANARFRQFNGLEVPFDDDVFDVVFIASVLHHVDRSLHTRFISEARRVLKPDGRLYLFEHNPINPFTRYLVKTCEFDKEAKLLGFPYCRKLLIMAHFTRVRKKFILFFPRSGILSPLMHLEKFLTWLPLGGQYYFRAVK